MKTQPQGSDALRHLAAKLEDHRVAMLTLGEPAGLASRPMTPLEMDERGDIWFMASRQTMAPLIHGGEPVNLAFVRHDSADYVSIAGRASLVEDAARKRALWTAMGRPWFEGPEDPDLVLLRVHPQHAEVWDGPDHGMTRVLALAASVMAGRQIGLGRKETINPPKA